MGSDTPASDDVLAVAAAHRLGLVRTDRWPTVAAHLVAAGADGDDLVTLAGLPKNASGWEVDQLVPGALQELDAPDLTDEQASTVAARVFALGLRGSGHPLLRALARLAPQLDYPQGLVTDAYYLEEYLDCECHNESRQDADCFEADIRTLPLLRIPVALAEALVGYTSTLG